MAFGGYSIAFFILANSLQPFVVYHEAQYRQQDMARAFKEMPTIPSKETFDFVIVGGGTAACILAHRLSQKFRVLVLEAGGEPPTEEDLLPQLNQLMKFLPQINWIYNSTRQSRSSLETGGINIATAGRLMGGSSSHNGAHYERGHPLDFDHWANATKDVTWKYDNVLKYFLRTENYHGRYTLLSGQHRRGGLLDVARTDVSFRPDWFFFAGKELGYATGLDPNGPQRIGFAGAEFNTRKGRRVSTYTAFVLPIEKRRRNLVVRRYSIVTEILIENSKAVGVLYTRHGVPRVVYASKEVTVSAGAYLSPVLLMKSGIGRPQHLRRTPVADLPVGLNLQDHIIMPMPLISVEDKSVFLSSLGTVTFAEFEQFKLRGTGLLAEYDSMHEGFFASSRAVAEGYPNWPDIQLYLGHAFSNGTDYLSCVPNVNRERSRGQIYMNDGAQTLEDSMKPIVDYNFFSDETDYEVMLEAIELCRKIVEDTEAFRKIGAKFVPYHLPACDHLEPRSRDYWICYIQQRASSNYHVTSTVAMGAKDDPKSVVDSKLRVLGVKSLRVVDASVMPFVPNANIAAAVMMIAEKASDEILHAWSL